MNITISTRIVADNGFHFMHELPCIVFFSWKNTLLMDLLFFQCQMSVCCNNLHNIVVATTSV